MSFAHRDADGKMKVYPTRRPEGTTTFFTGAGDDMTDPLNPIIGGGDVMDFDMTTSDASKEVALVFSEDVHIKDGYAIFENAPFGSYYDIEVWHPIAGKQSSFACRCPMLGSGMYSMDSDDVAVLPKDMILKIRITNSTPAAAFKVCGRLEMFRATTYIAP